MFQKTRLLVENESGFWKETKSANQGGRIDPKGW